jgi:isopentenyl diphosphate isomerase/L-lactate dehydrogenase-like FMN-dependent dehydrogenase
MGQGTHMAVDKRESEALDVEVLHEFVTLAKAKLEPGPWDYIMGGSETETTLLRNRLALDSIALRPRVLKPVEGVSAQTTFMDRKLRIPVILAPIGSIEDIVEGGAVTPSRGAASFGVVHMLSSVAKPGLEEVAASNDNFKLFQLYVRGDAGWIDDVIARVIASGYGGLAITVDLDYYGRRERDLAKRFKPTARNAGHATRHFQERFSWADVERIKAKHKIPLILKGIGTGEDAAEAVHRGIDAVYVSNHGGRQLDHGKGTMQVLPEVVEAVHGRAKVVVDGGFMRGTDIVKAMALGADAVGSGKLQALAAVAAGEAGIVRMLEILEDEMIRCLGLLGVKSCAELTPRHVEPIAPIGRRYGLASGFPLLGEGY